MDNLSAEIDNIANNWLKSIKNSSSFTMASKNQLRVNTPFSDSFGDQISLIILLTDNMYTVTDQGYTLWNLQTHGANLTDKKSQQFKNLMAILDKDDAELTDNEMIQIKGSKDELPQIINNLTQTLIQVSVLIYLSTG
ncbi:DUF1828 domain-containing protein [Secundilactobacillus yichangensis]|uniref:DUF1828 domain-containing protein n=1 Tax=Secundilactobacillus yichangensis TaxID=2799580 RepID=UPI001941A7F5|nr:DUF1828 domain-containing protein [Secundilactobacillus yichangensis]